MSNPRWTDDEMRETLDASAEKSRQIARLTAEVEKLRAALHEAAAELDAYYRAEYPGNHPYFKQRLAEAMRQNPARIAITQEKRDD
jgi:septal ring factor EnvC (AmiA/AmiB activator)